MAVEVEEVDLLDEHGQQTRHECDLTDDAVWRRLRDAARSGEYFAVVAGIPCNTYCVKRLGTADGCHDGLAKALRDRSHPAGLPSWELSKKNRELLACGNLLTVRALEICAGCFLAGGEVVIENPVDYGGGKHGWTETHTRHAPIWVTPWMQAFVAGTSSETLDFCQCTLGSDCAPPPHRPHTTPAPPPRRPRAAPVPRS